MNIVEFNHHGQNLKIEIKPGIGSNDLKKAMREMSDLYDAYFRELRLIGVRTGAPIHWEQVCRYEKLLRRKETQESIRLLRALGLLSTWKSGNFEIVSGPINLNPRDPETKTHLFFTRRDDAIAYARAEYAGSSCPWSVSQNAENVLLAKAV